MATAELSNKAEQNSKEVSLSKKELIIQALNETMSEQGSYSLFRDGAKLFARERKVFLKYVTGVFVSVMITLTLCFIFHTLFQIFAVHAIEDMLAGSFAWPTWLNWMSKPEAWVRNAGEWLILAISYLAIVYTSVRLAFLFMIYWTDEMVAMIMKLNRNRADVPFDLKRMLNLARVGIRFALRTLWVTLLFLGLSWIPVIGYPLFLLNASWSSGRDIVSTVIMVYAEEDISITEELRVPFRKSVKLGWVHALLYSIPFMGLLLLPVVYMTQVCGFVLAVENKMRILALGDEA